MRIQKIQGGRNIRKTAPTKSSSTESHAFLRILPYICGMRAFACDWLFTGIELLQDQTVSLDDDGVILSITPGKAAEATHLPVPARSRFCEYALPP